MLRWMELKAQRMLFYICYCSILGALGVYIYGSALSHKTAVCLGLAVIVLHNLPTDLVEDLETGLTYPVASSNRQGSLRNYMLKSIKKMIMA